MPSHHPTLSSWATTATDEEEDAERTRRSEWEINRNRKGEWEAHAGMGSALAAVSMPEVARTSRYTERARSVFSRYDRETRLSPLRRANRGGGASRTTGEPFSFSGRALPPPPMGWFRERGHFINTHTGVKEDVHLALLWQLFCEEDTAELLSTLMATRLRWWGEGRRHVLAALLCQAALLLLFASRPEVMAVTPPITTFQQTWYWHFTMERVARLALHGGAHDSEAHRMREPAEGSAASFFFSHAAPSAWCPPRLPRTFCLSNPYTEEVVQEWWTTSYTVFGSSSFPMAACESGDAMGVRHYLTEKERHTYTTYMPFFSRSKATHRAYITDAETVAMDGGRALPEGRESAEDREAMSPADTAFPSTSSPTAVKEPPRAPESSATGAMLLLDIRMAPLASEVPLALGEASGAAASIRLSCPASSAEGRGTAEEKDAAMLSASPLVGSPWVLPSPPTTAQDGGDTRVASLLLHIPLPTGPVGKTDLLRSSLCVTAHRLATVETSRLASWFATSFPHGIPSPSPFSLPFGIPNDGGVACPPCHVEVANGDGATAVVLSPAVRDQIWSAWKDEPCPCTAVQKESGENDVTEDQPSFATASGREEFEKREEEQGDTFTFPPTPFFSNAPRHVFPPRKRRGRPPLHRPPSTSSPCPSAVSRAYTTEDQTAFSSSSSSLSSFSISSPAVDTARRRTTTAVEPPPTVVPKRGRGRPRLSAALSTPASSTLSDLPSVQVSSSSFSWPALSIKSIVEDNENHPSGGGSLPERKDDTTPLPSLLSPRRGRPKGAKNKKKNVPPRGSSTSKKRRRRRKSKK